MEIQGKIIYVSPVQGGTTQAGKDWEKVEFVIENTEGQYPRKVAFTLFGKEKIQQNPLSSGAIVNVSFDIDAREYNGRWFNSVNAWKVVAVGQNAQMPQQGGVATQTPMQGTNSYGATDGGDLPF